MARIDKGRLRSLELALEFAKLESHAGLGAGIVVANAGEFHRFLTHVPDLSRETPSGSAAK